MVVLDRGGKVAEQGTWQELKDQRSSIQEFVNESSTRTSRLKEKNVPQALPLADPMLEIELVPANRQSGDTTVYFYYASVIGPWRVYLFVALMCCYVFFISFPGMHCPLRLSLSSSCAQ